MIPSRRRCLVGAAVAALSASSGSFAASLNLTASDVHVSEYPTVLALRWLGDQLALETDGRLALKLYHSGQLGRESDQIDLVRHGAIDMTRVFAGALNNAFPLTVSLCLPYLINSTPHFRRVVDGSVGARVLDGFADRGLVGLAIYDGGARCLYNTRRPILTPDDLRGLKLRVPPSDIFMRLFAELGGNPTPLAYGEAYSALQTRLIDGAENNIKSFHSSRQFEVARFWSQTEHSYAPDVLLMSASSFDALTAADQDLVRSLARASVAVQRRYWDESEAVARQAVVDAGVHVNAVDRQAFVRAVEPLVAQYRRDPLLAPLLTAIETEAQG